MKFIKSKLVIMIMITALFFSSSSTSFARLIEEKNIRESIEQAGISEEILQLILQKASLKDATSIDQVQLLTEEEIESLDGDVKIMDYSKYAVYGECDNDVRIWGAITYDLGFVNNIIDGELFADSMKYLNNGERFEEIGIYYEFSGAGAQWNTYDWDTSDSYQGVPSNGWFNMPFYHNFIGNIWAFTHNAHSWVKRGGNNSCLARATFTR